MTELEKRILETVKTGDGRGEVPMMVYIRYIQSLEDSGEMADVTEEQVEQVMESLCNKGYLEKRSNMPGTQLYFVKEEKSAAQGNFMAAVLAKFENADEQTIIKTVSQSAVDFITASGMSSNERVFQALVLGANVGFGGVHSLTEKQKRLVDAFFSSIYRGDMDTIYAMLCTDIDENSYTMLKVFCAIGQDRIGIPLLNYILSFAYMDGRPSQELIQKLEEIFSLPLLMHFMNGKPEEDEDDSEDEQDEEEEDEKDNEEVAVEEEDAEEKKNEEKANETGEEKKEEKVEEIGEEKDEEKADETGEEKADEAGEEKKEEKADETGEEKDEEEDEVAAFFREVKEWNRKGKEITAERNAEVRKRIRQAQIDIEESAKRAYDEASCMYQKTINQQEEIKAAAKASLSTLESFHFIKKRKQKKIIYKAETKIATARQSLTDAKSRYDSEIATAAQNAQKKAAAIEAAVARIMPMPERPKMPQHMVLDSNYYNAINAMLNGMNPGEQYTISEIIRCVPEFAEMTSQRVGGFVRQMVQDGLLDRFEHNGRAYFMISE